MDNTLTNTVIPSLIAYIIPINDVSIKISLSMLLTNLFSKLYDLLIKYFNFTTGYHFVEIDNKNQIYDTIMDSLLNHTELIKTCMLTHKNGNNKLFISSLNKDIIVKYRSGQININFKNVTNNTDKNEKNHNFNRLSIVFSSKMSVRIIHEYIDELVKIKKSNEINGIKIFKLSNRKEKENDVFTWNSVMCYSNKTLENTFYPENIINNFFNNFKEFVQMEDKYNKKGLNYKKTYLLYGEPGCGKSSAIKILASMYNLPIFIIDLDQFKENSNFQNAISDIKLHVGNSKYIVLFEDIDRCNMFSRYYDNRITSGCFMNVLDGVEDSYNRIIIMTTNKINIINDCVGLNRPGRIDNIIEFTNCTREQIIKTLEHYYEHTFEDNGLKLDIKTNIQPCVLMQIIEQNKTIDDVLKKLSTNCNIVSGFDTDLSSNYDNAGNRKSKLPIHVKRKQKTLLKTVIDINKLVIEVPIDTQIEDLKLKQQIKNSKLALLKNKYNKLKKENDQNYVDKMERILEKKLTDSNKIDDIINSINDSINDSTNDSANELTNGSINEEIVDPIINNEEIVNI